ncbi:hypothetical protein PAECIP111893_01080 [Paenibacillus plantiphilus]|uniref:MYXO-CTERM domain-containing protein n=1 Tax=Paenibacillus plantiphilus TaxID=2905650 RepID=A0ABM9BYU0_9BACL|nr:WGxxGxxG family protein [Paenibacillus plantiphilus]CAH1197920.1 hypothetical protein PAECIP111893_01080 [Paenibacillus plantiphilus]
MKKLVTSCVACAALSAMLLVPLSFAEGNMTRPHNSRNYDTKIQTNGTPATSGVNLYRTPDNVAPGNNDNFGINTDRINNDLTNINRTDNFRTNNDRTNNDRTDIYRTNNLRTNNFRTNNDRTDNFGTNNLRTNNLRTNAAGNNDNDFNWGWLGLLGLLGLAGLRSKNRDRDHA